MSDGRRAVVRHYGRAVVGGLVVGVAAALIERASGTPIRVWLACLLGVVAAVLLAALVDAYARIDAAEPFRPRRRQESILTDRKRGGHDATVRTVERAMTDPEWFEALRRRLVQVTEERLRTVHGIELATDKDRARELVGDDLVELAERRPSRPPDRRRLDEWLTRLEEQ